MDIDFKFPIEEYRITKVDIIHDGKTKTVYELRECYFSENYTECFGSENYPYQSKSFNSLTDVIEFAKTCNMDDVVGRNVITLAPIDWGDFE